ncbi:OmpH family outer membrane protein [Flavobacterium silvaticum]|uniref:OmpH family outer membrane protein n=1 Tax=Flavobacterium silvaticum TaxID=1852020 RepID=A0A972FS15_9FLAO|nr:OmpH family outer membrane protein [Flavobacterium silvaticum]NMH27443.1 OmpH family outer membrane protein [Flavobacterium silvaticum]
MKRILFLLFTLGFFATEANSQGRGIKIGYIDMEYILQNVPDFAQANNELEQKAQKWKQEIETKKNDIAKLKDGLKTERVLLTKELIEEREEEIAFQEKELLDYQQKRFGPTGDLVTQKSVLIKPIQDQVFTAAQDIADAKKYDFIFDKSSDLTMLFAAKKYDISDQVVRSLTRASRREQMSKKQLKEEAAKEAKEDMIDENPALQERQKVLDEKKAAREKLMADRKAAADAKRQEAADKREQQKAEREAKKNGTAVPPTTPPASPEATEGAKSEDKTEKPAAAAKTAPSETTEATTPAQDAKKKSAEERAQILEDRRKALEEKRKKAIEDREAAKKAKQQKAAEAKETTETQKDTIKN